MHCVRGNTVRYTGCLQVGCERPVDVSKVKVKGKALDSDVYAKEQTNLSVDCNNAGPGDYH